MNNDDIETMALIHGELLDLLERISDPTNRAVIIWMLDEVLALHDRMTLALDDGH